MKTVNEWLNEYGESHKNDINKLIHWLCVPAIFFSIVGLLYTIKLPWIINTLSINVAIVVVLLITLYYLQFSISLGIGMFIFGVLCLFLCYLIEKFIPVSLWLVSVIIFVIAWIGQFYGHKVEGKKPSFLKDIQFLLIGPMWLMSFIYKKLRINF
ncbi:MAG: Mpo1-like protein [Ginsengibacter sp.]